MIRNYNNNNIKWTTIFFLICRTRNESLPASSLSQCTVWLSVSIIFCTAFSFFFGARFCFPFSLRRIKSFEFAINGGFKFPFNSFRNNDILCLARMRLSLNYCDEMLLWPYTWSPPHLLYLSVSLSLTLYLAISIPSHSLLNSRAHAPFQNEANT